MLACFASKTKRCFSFELPIQKMLTTFREALISWIIPCIRFKSFMVTSTNTQRRNIGTNRRWLHSGRCYRILTRKSRIKIISWFFLLFHTVSNAASFHSATRRVSSAFSIVIGWLDNIGTRSSPRTLSSTRSCISGGTGRSWHSLLVRRRWPGSRTWIPNKWLWRWISDSQRRFLAGRRSRFLLITPISWHPKVLKIIHRWERWRFILCGRDNH